MAALGTKHPDRPIAVASGPVFTVNYNETAYTPHWDGPFGISQP